MPKYRPKSKREARLWNFFNRQDWVFWPIWKWPSWIQRIAVKEYKKNRDRFSMFFFLVANGLEPNRAVFWVTAKDVKGPYDNEQKGFVITGDYTAKATRQFYQMRRQLKDGSLFKGNKLYFNLTNRRMYRK